MTDKIVRSVNPADESVIETFTPFANTRVEATLEKAEKTFTHWRNTSFATRADAMRRAADILETRLDTFATAITREMGKPISEARGEVRKCALVCRHYADHAEQYLKDEPLKGTDGEAYARHLPLGPVLAVMPWNFPFWQVFRFAAPTLMAGNVGLLKHASNVWRCALHIEEVFLEAGFPEGCFQTLLIGSGKVEPIIRDRRVRAVTLTGSGPAGRAVAATAGSVLKPSLLELGGSDAFIVMPSADLEAVLDTAVKARIRNTGQSCIAAKRFFVHADIYDAFEAGMQKRFAALKVGNPLQEGTEVGPLAMQQIRDDLAKQMEQTTSAGASAFRTGQSLPDKGFWFDPTILTDIPAGTPSADEEMFGPVANLWRVGSLQESIAKANDSVYGLGSAIFTQDEAEISEAASMLEAGATFINALVASDPHLPFGGIKESGYGRELYRDGILAFMNRKTVFRAR